ncbi:hypothetical protein B0A49_05805 [Cryomyces minteri]|uniref:Uncharacterized protein n=1 Tax=Cryomyces minteri TaxID=331657 RepID=A0A4U0X2M5_9PEZI|nr:hypothetical protein B0A49_05805 [Cryomyces minteri]
MVYDGASHTALSAIENVALRDQFVAAINGLNQHVKDWQEPPAGRLTKRCAWLTYSKRKNEVGDEKAACPACRKKGRICVRTEVGCEPTIVPLSAELRGDLSADDLRFWRTA